MAARLKLDRLTSAPVAVLLPVAKVLPLGANKVIWAKPRVGGRGTVEPVAPVLAMIVTLWPARPKNVHVVCGSRRQRPGRR